MKVFNFDGCSMFSGRWRIGISSILRFRRVRLFCLSSPIGTRQVAARAASSTSAQTGAAVCATSLLAGTAAAQSPTNIFAPAATPARSIFDLSMLVLSITLAIFLIVAGLLLYALIRYRHRPEDSDREPAQIYGSNQD